MVDIHCLHHKAAIRSLFGSFSDQIKHPFQLHELRSPLPYGLSTNIVIWNLSQVDFLKVLNIRKWNKIGALTIIMELDYTQSGVLAPTEAVLVAPKKWVKRG